MKEKSNSLAKKCPEIAFEWHPTKNGNITPELVSYGSHKKVWWKCIRGHEWEIIIHYRTVYKRGCPYCANRKVCEDNCLETVCPKIAAEWHPTKNGNITPKSVSCGSSKKVWWKCNEGHEWQAFIKKRAGNAKTKCPYCTNKKVCKNNSLKTVYPKIAAEWHTTKNGNSNPESVVYGSDKKCWWKCIRGHEWQAKIETRTIRKRRCPYCTNKKVCKDNCLKTVCPEIAAEWHTTKNGDITSECVTFGSEKKVWWQCNKGHEWQAKVCNRTGNKNKNCCPRCNESKGEKRIALYLDEKNILYKKEYKFDDCKNKNYLRFDFAIYDKDKLKFLIEYQGEQHYRLVIRGSDRENCKKIFKQLQENDKIKEEYCNSKNIPLLKIPYWKHEEIEKIIEEYIRL